MITDTNPKDIHPNWKEAEIIQEFREKFPYVYIEWGETLEKNRNITNEIETWVIQKLQDQEAKYKFGARKLAEGIKKQVREDIIKEIEYEKSRIYNNPNFRNLRREYNLLIQLQTKIKESK